MGFCISVRVRPRFSGLEVQSRWFSGSHRLPSGHNRWSKIKHDKGANDRVKSRERTLLSHAIFLASKHGDPDPSLNSKLAIAIANAKKGQLSKTSIEAAIAKGQGKSISGAPLQLLTVEAMLQHGVAALIEYQTESKTRVLQDIRALINKRGGSITPTAFLFEKKGKIWFHGDGKTGLEEAMDEAIEAGATDITSEDGRVVVETDPGDVKAVAERIQNSLKLQIERYDIVCEPRSDTMVELSSQQSDDLSNMLELIEDEPSLQNLYINADLVD